VSWRTSLDSFDDIVRLRERYYEPRLPGIDGEFRKLDAEMRVRLEQKSHVEQRLQQLLIAPRPELLATAEEQHAAARIDSLEAALGSAGGPGYDALAHRLRRLKGALVWRQAGEYHQRLTDAHEHLRQLNQDVDALTARYQAFVRARQAATHSYVGYAAPIGGLRERIAAAQETLKVLMERQGELLEAVASRELTLRQERLEAYQNQARFAFADSYDRAAKAQAQ
jgi:chromosome segregation ATPase